MRHDNRSCLVANAIPGDTITYTLSDKRRGVWRGRLEEVLHSAPERVNAACSVADRCGGCAFQFLKPEIHADVKSTWIRDAFNPFIEPRTTWHGVESMDSIPRRRARWWRGIDEQGVYLGFRARGSHAVIRQPQCMVVHPEMNLVCRSIEALLPEPIRSVQITRLPDGMHLVLEGERDIAPDLSPEMYRVVAEQLPDTPIQWWWRSPNTISPLEWPVKRMHDILPCGEDSIRLMIGPDDFIQGCEEGNAIMVRQVRQWAGDARRVVDLFSGAGNLSLPLASRHRHIAVIGADVDPVSIRHANMNAERLGANARYMQSDLFGSFDEETFSGADLIVLDPPRKGARKVCSRMTSLLPARIIMINCDVAAGARDAGILQKAGYRLRALRGVDLFPYTGHVETMSLWTR